MNIDEAFSASDGGMRMQIIVCIGGAITYGIELCDSGGYKGAVAWSSEPSLWARQESLLWFLAALHFYSIRTILHTKNAKCILFSSPHEFQEAF